MDWFRIRHTLGMCLCGSGVKRAEYLRKHQILQHVGNNCMVMFRKIPLYSKLISIGDNVWVASNVNFVPHDVIHRMLNNLYHRTDFSENIGCIEIGNNVFIGANTTILPNVYIGSNTIIAAGSVVNKSLSGNGVYGGVPAKYICSLDTLVKKRESSKRIEIIRDSRGELSNKTIEEYWNNFEENKHGGDI